MVHQRFEQKQTYIQQMALEASKASSQGSLHSQGISEGLKVLCSARTGHAFLAGCDGLLPAVLSLQFRLTFLP